MSIITLMTDFGTQDYYVGAMKGVIKSLSPDAQLVDISHSIRPYDKVHGAFVLGQVWSRFPVGTVHLVVIDPGVGSERKMIVGRCEGRYFVTPDNGLMSFVAHEYQIDAVHYVEASRHFLDEVSSTFHGRDVMAPTAAQLANGILPEAFGSECHRMVKLKIPLRAAHEGNTLCGSVLVVDHFGTLVSNLHASQLSQLAGLGRDMVVSVDGTDIGPVADTFSDVPQGEVVSYVGSAGYLEIAINRGRADSRYSRSAHIQVRSA